MPGVLNDDVLAVARARGEQGESVTAIARHLKIGRSTLFWALHPHPSMSSSMPRPTQGGTVISTV